MVLEKLQFPNLAHQGRALRVLFDTCVLLHAFGMNPSTIASLKEVNRKNRDSFNSIQYVLSWGNCYVTPAITREWAYFLLQPQRHGPGEGAGLTHQFAQMCRAAIPLGMVLEKCPVACIDPHDQKWLDAAHKIKATHIITYDGDLRRLDGELGGCQVVTPKEFMTLMTSCHRRDFKGIPVTASPVRVAALNP